MDDLGIKEYENGLDLNITSGNSIDSNIMKYKNQPSIIVLMKTCHVSLDLNLKL